MTTKPRIELEFIAPHTAIVKVTTGNETVQQFMHIPGYDSPVPAGSYTRTDEGAHIGPEGETDWHGLYLSENRRAEKAERERDSWESIAQQTARSIDALRADQPHALTPEAITDAMVKRLRDEERALGLAAVSSEDVARALLTAALAEPTRDPRAEEIQADLATAEEPEMDDEDRRLIADHLAALGYRKTGAES